MSTCSVEPDYTAARPIVDVHVPSFCECGATVVGVWYNKKPYYCQWFRHSRYAALRKLLEQNRCKSKHVSDRGRASELFATSNIFSSEGGVSERPAFDGDALEPGSKRMAGTANDRYPRACADNHPFSPVSESDGLSMHDVTPSASTIDATPSASTIDATPSASTIDATPSALTIDATPSASTIDATTSASTLQESTSGSTNHDSISSFSGSALTSDFKFGPPGDSAVIKHPSAFECSRPMVHRTPFDQTAFHSLA